MLQLAILTPEQIFTRTADQTGVFWGYAGLSGLALLVSAVLLASMYMWATLFRSSQLNAYVKLELYELFVSGVLIVMILGMVGGLNTITVESVVPPSMLGTPCSSTDIRCSLPPPGTTIFQATVMYYDRVADDLAGWLGLNYLVTTYIDSLSSQNVVTRPAGFGISASPFAGFASPIKQLMSSMATALSIAYIVTKAQANVFIYTLYASLKYLLPAGIFFRSFTPTRRLGGTFFGIVAAFVLFFPLMSVISYLTMYNSNGPLLTATNYYADTFGGNVHGGFAERMTAYFEHNGQSGVLGFFSGAFGGLGILLQNAVGGLAFGLIMFPISTIALAFMVGFIMPVFNIFIISQAAKDLSRSFGEEVDISSLTRVI